MKNVMRISNWGVILLLPCALGLFAHAVEAQEPAPAAGVSYAGDWSGTTSEGFPISLKVEGDSVTQIQYKITHRGLGWRATTTLYDPVPISAVIRDGKVEHSNSTLSLTGVFASDTSMTGTLRTTHAHPQGLGTGVGDVTFSATKMTTQSEP